MSNTNNTKNTKNTKTFADAMAIQRTDTMFDGMFSNPATAEPETPATDGGSTPQAQEQPKQKQKGVGKYADQPTAIKDGSRKQMAFKLPVETMEQIRRFSYWERVEQWQFVADAVQAAVDKYEKKNGELKPIPDR